MLRRFFRELQGRHSAQAKRSARITALTADHASIRTTADYVAVNPARHDSQRRVGVTETIPQGLPRGKGFATEANRGGTSIHANIAGAELARILEDAAVEDRYLLAVLAGQC